MAVRQWLYTQDVVAGDLFFPTAMTFGPDGALYVNEWGSGMPPGGGSILCLEMP